MFLKLSQNNSGYQEMILANQFSPWLVFWATHEFELIHSTVMCPYFHLCVDTTKFYIFTIFRFDAFNLTHCLLVQNTFMAVYEYC